MASLTNGNEFAAPSTAPFGESNEENVEDTTVQGQVLLPATVATPGGLNENKTAQVEEDDRSHSPARSMADMIGNAAASAGSTPLSYEMVTMSSERGRERRYQKRCRKSVSLLTFRIGAPPCSRSPIRRSPLPRVLRRGMARLGQWVPRNREPA